MEQKFAPVVGCIDFRFLHGPNGLSLTQEFAIGLGFKCYPISRAGGVQDLIRPPQEGFRESLIRDIGIPIEHKGAKNLFLVNHEDCKAYRCFSSSYEEFRVHVNDLRDASQILGDIFPGVKIEMFFAELEQRKPDIFIFRKVPRI